MESGKQVIKDVIGLYVFGLLYVLTFWKDLFLPLYRLAFASRRPVVVRTPEGSHLNFPPEQTYIVFRLYYSFHQNYLSSGIL